MTEPIGAPPNVIVRASAGSGKTYGLTVRFVKLLASGARPDAILATTFTRKASGEILRRVLGRLALASSDPHDRERLSSEIGIALTGDAAAELLRRVVGQLHRLRISTLDSFFGQVAQCHGLELALPPRWRIAEGTADARQRDDAIQDVFREDSQQDLLTLLHLLEQGDTSRRVAQRTREIVDDLYQLFRTTSPEAWRSIPRRKQLSSEDLDAAIERFQNLQFEKKRFQDAHAKACERVGVLDWLGFLDMGLTKKIVAGDPSYYRVPIDPAALDAYQPLIDHASGELTNRLLDRTWATHALLERFDERYGRLKARSGQLTFDDITHALERASWTDLGERAAFRLDGRIEHLLLDEFQDTSWSQWRVLEPLVLDATAPDTAKSFFCVGDVKQAIYGWRGGHAGILQQLDRHLPGVSTDSLSLSYRSSPEVIEVVNRVFGSLASNPALSRWAVAARDWTEAFEPHKTTRTDLSGYCRLRVAEKAPDGEKQKPTTLAAVADEVAAIFAATGDHGIGVLLRGNDDVGRVILNLRLRHGIEASEESGATLTSSLAVSLLMSALRLADHPGDSVARAHVAASPLAAEFGDLRHDNDNAASWQSRRVRRALLDDGYGETILRWAVRLAPSCDPRDARRLDQLTDVAFAYEPIATLRPADFIRHVELQRVVDPGAARVRVMTIHQSKGLEFDAVVMAAPSDTMNRAPKIVASSPSPFEAIDHVLRYANESVQPLLPRAARQTIESHKTNETREQLNVLYVAMTRAIRALHIVVPPQSKTNDSWASLVRHALAEKAKAEPGAVLFELGSAQWYQADADEDVPHQQHRPIVTHAPAPDKEPSAQSPTIVFATSVRAEAHRHTTPSDGRDVSSLDVSSLLNFKSRAARQRGLLFHGWLEMIQWLDAGPPADNDLARAANRSHFRRADLDQHIREFRALVAQPNVSHALSRSAYTSAAFAKSSTQIDLGSKNWSIWNELPFALTTGAGWTTGRFDRLVVLQDGDRAVAADVIDFKTDAIERHDNEALAVATASHRAQMQAYGLATCKMLQLPAASVRLRLLFVTADAIVDVAHAETTE